MKEDIHIPKVENVTVVIARKINELNKAEWNVYLLNQNNFGIENVIVAAKGYGEKEGESQRTSTLRHYFEAVKENDYVLIEPIHDEVFHLANEYWVSYYYDSEAYDKKFVFLPGSITEEHLNFIPLLDMEGILHS